MMKPSGDYTVHFADPDIFFQWHDVLQVIIPRTSAGAAVGARGDEEGSMTCPICLSPPTAPRMTRCGHVFCFPCILHYLNTSDVEKWIRCPICFDSVNEKQLKSVKWFNGHQDAVAGSETVSVDSQAKTRRKLRMRLMQRPHITTLALPRSSTWPSDLLSPHQAPLHFLPDVFAFSKFMLATPSYLLADLETDLNELQTERRMLESMSDELGIIFIDAAQSKVRLQMEDSQVMDTVLLKRAVDKAQRELDQIQNREARMEAALARDAESYRAREDTPQELLSVKPMVSQIPKDSGHRSSKPRRNVNPPPPSTSTYYYYQSASGSPIFLHPLDNRILLSHFTNYPSFPNDINVEIEAVSEGAVNDELRKRCKYLALPEGADVVFVEADLESVVGADTLKNFEGALKTRRAKRKDKSKKEDRAKWRAEENEKERAYGNPLKWGDLGGFSSANHIPDWSTARPDAETGPEVPPTSLAQQPTGAWGSRSFASALHASPSTQPSPQAAKGEEDKHDEWDLDVAWHEMQGNGRRKQGRNQKMVILGGGTSGARRR
ncbi:hypothetical protein JB92DRAFT_191708 [Gautieria morchelliformis]|nr:hypothetical protein JB92DRAFT_191708 [Gautieria morchelliformis]